MDKSVNMVDLGPTCWVHVGLVHKNDWKQAWLTDLMQWLIW